MSNVRYQALGLLEEQSQAGLIDLFYGDESSVSEEAGPPVRLRALWLAGWQAGRLAGWQCVSKWLKANG